MAGKQPSPPKDYSHNLRREGGDAPQEQEQPETDVAETAETVPHPEDKA